MHVPMSGVCVTRVVGVEGEWLCGCVWRVGCWVWVCTYTYTCTCTCVNRELYVNIVLHTSRSLLQKERQTGAIRTKDEQIDSLEKTIEDLQRRIKMLEADLENAEDENEAKTA